MMLYNSAGWQAKQANRWFSFTRPAAMKQKQLLAKKKFKSPRIVLVCQHGRSLFLIWSINGKTLNSDDRKQPLSLKKNGLLLLILAGWEKTASVHCYLGIFPPISPPWRHVKTIYRPLSNSLQPSFQNETKCGVFVMNIRFHSHSK